MAVVIFCIASYLTSQERGLFKSLINAGKLNLGNHKPLVVAQELIYLECMPSVVDKVTILVYNATLTQFHKLPSLIDRNFTLPLVTAQPAVKRRAFYCEISLVCTHTHAGGISPTATYVTLCYAVATVGLCLVAVARNKEFTFNFNCHNYSPSSANSIRYDFMKPSILPSITPFTSDVW